MGGFSHGMRQRVKLAQALAHEPDLLLLDEPLNGLDPAQRREIIDVLHRLGDEGRTVIVSSHVLHEVERMAPQVLVLVNGHLVAEGQTSAIRQLISERPRTIRVAAGGDGRAARRRARRRRRRRRGALPGRHARVRDRRRRPVQPRRCRRWRGAPTRSSAGSSLSATTSRASTPTCTSAPGGRAGDLGPVYRLTLRALLLQRRTILARPAGARAGAGGVRLRGRPPGRRRPPRVLLAPRAAAVRARRSRPSSRSSSA